MAKKALMVVAQTDFQPVGTLEREGLGICPAVIRRNGWRGPSTVDAGAGKRGGAGEAEGVSWLRLPAFSVPFPRATDATEHL